MLTTYLTYLEEKMEAFTQAVSDQIFWLGQTAKGEDTEKDMEDAVAALETASENMVAPGLDYMVWLEDITGRYKKAPEKEKDAILQEFLQATRDTTDPVPHLPPTPISVTTITQPKTSQGKLFPFNANTERLTS